LAKQPTKIAKKTAIKPYKTDWLRAKFEILALTPT
jgi:hypothetical protein